MSAGARHRGANPARMKLRVSYTGGAGFVVNWPALCAIERGFYTDEGLDVELLPMSQDEQTHGLISGETPVERRGPDGSPRDEPRLPGNRADVR